MGLSIHFPKFLKNTFAHKHEEEDAHQHASPATSIYSYTTSPPASVTSTSFSRDPMRCGNHPDVVGQYYDPMGGKYSRYQGYDATNTGA